MLALRRMAAASTGVLNKSQRCLVSCVFICFGQFGDPWQRIIKELVNLWINLMPQYYAKSPIDLALAWSHAKQAVVEGPTPYHFEDIALVKLRWNNVTGPVSNTIALLFSIGWNPVCYYEWLAPNGDSWAIPVTKGFLFSPASLIAAMQTSAGLKLWAKASTHMNGAGLEHGIAFNYSVRQLKK